MKNLIILIVLLFFTGLNSKQAFSQIEDRETILISQVRYGFFNYTGNIKGQLQIDLLNREVYYRKNVHRKFKKIKTTQDILLFTDSVKLERVKQISKSIKQRSADCLYHNDYGYFRVELLKYCREDLIYGETFLINTPYGCHDEKDSVIVRAYKDLITNLFNKK